VEFEGLIKRKSLESLVYVGLNIQHIVPEARVESWRLVFLSKLFRLALSGVRD
jgi:hypothetical protein